MNRFQAETVRPRGRWSELLRSLRSYYRGSGGRDQQAFYDLESSLPCFDDVNRILGRHKRGIILSFLEGAGGGGGGRPRRVLEIGCGSGYFTRILAARGHVASGVDISPRKIEKALSQSRRLGLDGNPGYRVADVTLLGRSSPLDRWLDDRSGAGAAGRFSTIIAADVLEHLLSRPGEALASIRARLAAGGQLIASVPSRLCLRDPGHVWRIAPQGWADIFERSGYEIRGRRTSRVFWYRLPTPLPLAEVFDLRAGR